MATSTVDILRYWRYIKSIGITSAMEEYEVRKLNIFNQLNFYGIAMGLVVPLISIFALRHLPPLAWYAAGSPVAIGIIVLWLNYERYYEFARMVYFSCYPIVTCMVYLGKADVGIELFFILYGIMSVFFLQQRINIIVSLSLSMICYFISAVMPHNYYFNLAFANYWFYVLNHLLAIGFIFYALYLVKK
jgi:two-component system sensor histidine kinase/response regulator